MCVIPLSDKIMAPDVFYGFKPGTDRKLVRWDKVVEYFWHLDESSSRVKVVEAGRSTEGYPMILAYVSSEENLGRLDDIRGESWRISHPGSATEKEIEEMVI